MGPNGDQKLAFSTSIVPGWLYEKLKKDHRCGTAAGLEFEKKKSTTCRNAEYLPLETPVKVHW